MKTISFCIVCMNRLHQLQETLPASLNLYADRPGVDFVLLNYNSHDGMEEWVKAKLSGYISTNKLKYYHTPDPDNFSHSHSKNMAFRLAEGEILCSINADHYIGEGFDTYLRSHFRKSPRSFITPYVEPNTKQKYIPPRDVVGKICVRRFDFNETGGFDERFKNYGFEDIDFVNRLLRHGLKKITLSKQKFLQFIEHSDEERIKLKAKDQHRVYVHYISPETSTVLYLMADGTFERVTFRRVGIKSCTQYAYAYKDRNYIYNFEVVNNRWQRGQWSENKTIGSIKLHRLQTYLPVDPKTIRDPESNKSFHLIEEGDNLTNLSAIRSFMKNLTYMSANTKNKIIKVNNYLYGQGVVFKNFSNEKYSY